MSPAGIIAHDAIAMIGKCLAPELYEITKRDIRRFAQAIGDSTPIFHREENAENTKSRGMSAPPLFFFSLSYEDVPEAHLREDGRPKTEFTVKLPANRTIGGASEVELDKPIRPGDVITVKKKIVDVYSKAGKGGTLYFTVIESTYTNQKGEFVAREKATFIER